MKNIYLAVFLLIILSLLVVLFFVDIPSPSQLVSEEYKIEIK